MQEKINRAFEGKNYSTDAVIIGAGPVGLFAVFELGLWDIKAHLIDVLDKPGGQCSELYPEKPIYDIPAYPVISGQELTDNLLKQIEPFSPVFHMSQMASSLKKSENGNWIVETDRKTRIEAKVVVIAAGGGSFMPKKPNLENLSDYEGKSVFYSIRKKEDFRGKDILIAGGGDSALDWALSLTDIAKSVSLIHRRDEFRAAPDSVKKMREQVDAGRIRLYIGDVLSLNGENGNISSVTCGKKGKEPYNIDCNTFIPFYGLTMKLGPIADFGLNLHENLINVDTEKFETDTEGIFAVGDINYYPGKLKLILSGFHECALMAKQAFSYVYPDKRFRFQYTTSSSELQGKLGV